GPNQLLHRSSERAAGACALARGRPAAAPVARPQRVRVSARRGPRGVQETLHEPRVPQGLAQTPRTRVSALLALRAPYHWVSPRGGGGRVRLGEAVLRGVLRSQQRRAFDRRRLRPD